MIDIHSHIVFGADDGARSMEETVSMLKAAGEAGVDTIFATPHYSRELADSSNYRDNFASVRNAALEYGISLLPGYEVRIDPALPEKAEALRKITLNGSSYLLVELPFSCIPPYASAVLFKLSLAGIIPVIAHPERNIDFVRNFRLFKEFADAGYLMQADAASIAGRYGHKVRRFVKKSIKLGYISFVASDAHRPDGYSEWYRKAYKKVKKWIGEEKAGSLFAGN